MCSLFFFHCLSWPASISDATCGASGLNLDYEKIKMLLLLLLLRLLQTKFNVLGYSTVRFVCHKMTHMVRVIEGKVIGKACQTCSENRLYRVTARFELSEVDCIPLKTEPKGQGVLPVCNETPINSDA